LSQSSEAYKKQLVRSARGKASLTGLLGCVGGWISTMKALAETFSTFCCMTFSQTLVG